MSINANFEDIIQVAAVQSAREVNERLNLGWVMLNVESSQYSEHGWYTIFVLGWKKSAGDIRHPTPVDYKNMFSTDSESTDPKDRPPF